MVEAVMGKKAKRAVKNPMLVWNIPTLLTLSRLLLAPLFAAVYFYYAKGFYPLPLTLVLIGIVAISELSDLFDGFLARRYNQVTEFGKLLDPMADSIFRLSVFFTFTQGGVGLPLLLVLPIFYRDSLIGTLRTICALRGITLAARLSGKIKAASQGIAIFMILILLLANALGFVEGSVVQSVSFYLVAAVALYTVASGVEYLYAHRRHIKKAITG